MFGVGLIPSRISVLDGDAPVVLVVRPLWACETITESVNVVMLGTWLSKSNNLSGH